MPTTNTTGGMEELLTSLSSAIEANSKELDQLRKKTATADKEKAEYKEREKELKSTIKEKEATLKTNRADLRKRETAFKKEISAKKAEHRSSTKKAKDEQKAKDNDLKHRERALVRDDKSAKKEMSDRESKLGKREASISKKEEDALKEKDKYTKQREKARDLYDRIKKKKDEGGLPGGRGKPTPNGDTKISRDDAKDILEKVYPEPKSLFEKFNPHERAKKSESPTAAAGFGVVGGAADAFSGDFSKYLDNNPMIKGLITTMKTVDKYRTGAKKNLVKRKKKEAGRAMKRGDIVKGADGKLKKPFGAKDDDYNDELEDMIKQLNGANESLDEIRDALKFGSIMKLFGFIANRKDAASEAIRDRQQRRATEKSGRGGSSNGGYDIDMPDGKDGKDGKGGKDNNKDKTKPNTKKKSVFTKMSDVGKRVVTSVFGSGSSTATKAGGGAATKAAATGSKKVGKKVLTSVLTNIGIRMLPSFALGPVGWAASLAGLGFTAWDLYQMSKDYEGGAEGMYNDAKDWATSTYDSAMGQEGGLDSLTSGFTPMSATAPTGDNIESLSNTIYNNERADSNQQKIPMITQQQADAKASGSGGVSSVVNSNSNTTNHYGSSFNFAPSKYQTSFDKGTMVQR